MIRNYNVADASRIQGFALVISLMLMGFLVILLLSLSTLVRVEHEASSQIRSQSQAELNAILGLTEALGILQTHLGPDQRVSASAEVLASTHPSRVRHTGVWISDPDGANVEGNTYADGELVRWLVSDFESANDNETPAPTSDVVTLVGEKSLNPVMVEPSQIDGDIASGRYAWWIGDEGIKAPINLEDVSLESGPDVREEKRAALTTLASLARSNVASLSGLSTVDLSGGGVTEKLFKTSDLIFADSGLSADTIKAQFHDLTTYSSSVLADVRNGGLKQDLSLAFELSDADFNSSVFGSGGPETILSPGFGRVQPIFRLPNRTGVDANGPTWHLLRDYYTIYQRMETPLTNPILSAQAFVPNHKELNPGGLSLDPERLPSLRFSVGFAANGEAQGDPLRTDGGEQAVPVKANYLPYIQRHITSFGLNFEPVAAPGANPQGYDFRRLSLVYNPSFVTHNPYNVSIRHNGMATAVDHLRFSIEAESLLDPSYNKTTGTNANFHMLKVPAGTIPPGAVQVYQGVPDGSTEYSEVGPNDEYSRQDLIEDIIIPVDPGDPSAPNLTVSYGPLGNLRWAYWMHHGIAIPGVDEPIPPTLSRVAVRGNQAVSNYGAVRTDINLPYNTWYGGEDSGRTLSTEDYPVSTPPEPPFPFLNYDLFLKPAERDLGSNPFAYPGLTHTNPLAPVMQSNNLFGNVNAKPDYGWPTFAPNWQLRVYTTNTQAPGMDALETSGANGENAFYGVSQGAGGATRVAAIELPTTPPVSIGQLQNANISIYGHMPALAIGNSFASPFIPRTEDYEIYQNNAGNDRIFYDLSYLSNQALWDSYFFSSYSRPYSAVVDQYLGTPGDSFDIAFDPENYTDGSTMISLPNPRMKLFAETESVDDIKTKLFDDSGNPLSVAYERAAENIMVKGGFNVHSTSVRAWNAILASARDSEIYQSGQTNEVDYGDNLTPLTRLQQPIAGAFACESDSYDEDEAWGGFATLTDPQLEVLAQAIVDEIKERTAAQGTVFTSLSAFINRSLTDDNFGLAGVLQAAIDRSGINDAFSIDIIEIKSDDLMGDAGDFPVASNILDVEGNARSTATTATGYLTQGDVLQAIGSFISVRSDTFRIRAYGEAVNAITGEPTARALCEAIVQRIPEPVNPNANNPNASGFWEPVAGDNFGRKFIIVDFRWLDEDEV